MTRTVTILDDPATFKRFMAKVLLDDSDKCWEWVGAKNNSDYGQFWFSPRLSTSHRLMFEAFVGPTPSGKQLDHLCRNPSCVNYTHLEIVTNRENTVKGKRSKLNPNKTSKFVGVSWRKETHKWTSRFVIDGKTRYLGQYKSEVDASLVYKYALLFAEDEYEED